MTYSRAVPSQKPDSGVRPVSQNSDRAEREADRAADAAVQGQRVPEWSVAATPISRQVQRQEAGGEEKTEKEKYVEAAKKTGEAVLETEAGKKLKEKVLDDPTVRKIKAAATSPVGLGVGLTAVAGGVTALALTGKELPIQPPEIPFDKITPGLSGKLTYSGPVNAPTFVGITITYKEQGPKPGGPKQTGTEKLRAENAKLAAELAAFREGLRFPPGSKEAEEQRMIQEAIAKMVFRSSPQFGPPSVLVPLAEPGQPKKDQPVQRSPASAETNTVNELNVDATLTEPGHTLDPETKQRMETRFGHDFSSVRIHDDARSSAVAASLDAAAFTVDDHIVFGAGRFEPGSSEGTHLLAHELAHVVQHRSTQDSQIHRRSVLESIGIWLGIAEGTWQDSELRTYLKAVTKAGKIDGSYDADNKARAIVGRWKSSAAGWDLLPHEKKLLVREMLHGPTLDEDEKAIIDLLELSDASDLRDVLGGADSVPYSEIEPEIQSSNRARLHTFVATRFRGGRGALLAGRVEVIGKSRPGGAPEFAFDADKLDSRFESDRTVDDLIEIIDTFSSRDRRQALHHLSQVRRKQLLDRERRLLDQRDRESDESRREAIVRVGKANSAALLKVDRVLLHYLGEQVPATEAALVSGTGATDPARTNELQEALRPEVRTSRGVRARFQPTLQSETKTYEDKVRGKLPELIDEAYQRLVAGKGPAEHADPTKTRQLAAFEAIGNVSRDEVLAVFGSVLTAPTPPMVADTSLSRGNIHDRFTDFPIEMSRLTPDQRREHARQLVLYMFQTRSWVLRLNYRHDANPEFDARGNPLNDEARALNRVSRQFVSNAATVARLLEIDRGWPGLAEPRTGEVWVQRFRGANQEEDRLLLWKVFQTLIHEYLHTLAHADYRRYAGTLDPIQWNTLIEGVCSLLTEIVWDNVEPRLTDPGLRTRIEGTTYAALPPIDVPHPGMTGRYPTMTQALKLVDLVGIRNLYAAYFLGLVDRIGGPARRAP